MAQVVRHLSQAHANVVAWLLKLLAPPGLFSADKALPDAIPRAALLEVTGPTIIIGNLVLLGELVPDLLRMLIPGPCVKLLNQGPSVG